MAAFVVAAAAAVMSTSPFYPAVQEHTRAQRLQPQNAEIAVRLLDACLGADMLVCAAHQVRSLLRHPDAHLKSSQAWRCDGLASARVFGERAEAVRWCPHGQACRAVTNATADAAVAAGPMAALDGGLWRGENFVSVLKELLASEREWKGGSAQQQHNHATMQQMQGNGEIARKLYAKVLAPWSSPELAPSVDVLAHAYGNLAQLERGAAARRQLEAALSLLPAGESAAVWWREVAAVHAVGAKTSLARHAAKKAIKLRPDSAFAHALSGELDLTRHEWGKAHDGFARADALQAASAPEMPPCARWSSIAPRLERAQWWGGRAPATALPAARWSGRCAGHAPTGAAAAEYRELLLGCGDDHIKALGGGLHAAARRAAGATVPLPFEDCAFDEVHWCAPTLAAAEAWAEIRRVLRPTGLVQVAAGLPHPPESFAPVDAAPGEEDDAPDLYHVVEERVAAAKMEL